MTPLLTIAIPTWNRSGFLAQNLAQLAPQIAALPPGTVEIFVSDNCSSDDTGAVTARFAQAGLPLRYVRNSENVGWARNFAQCFDMALGKYVIIFGDDDLFVDGALPLLIDRLMEREYGAIFLKPYGFDEDFRSERPNTPGREKIFQDAQGFLIAINQSFSLISACVLNKSLMTTVDSREFIDTDLAAFHLMLRAALTDRPSLLIDHYLIASKRQNSFNYQFAEVFVTQFWQIVDAHVRHGLKPRTVRILERKRLLSYYPFYALDLRLSGRDDMAVSWHRFASRFSGRFLFHFWLGPTLWLPKPLAVLWGSATMAVGRALGGDMRRGLKFVWAKIMRRLSPGGQKKTGLGAAQ